MSRKCPEAMELVNSSNQDKRLSHASQADNIQSNIKRVKIRPWIIPILIVELFFSLMDFLSDFWSGFSLLKKLENKAWGIGSFVINWIPGVIGVIQIIAYNRGENVPNTILYSLASLIFCPLIPTLTILYLLCKVPKTSEDEQSREIRRSYCRLLSFAMLVRSLEGCIESPLQLLYKTILMFNGIIKFDFTESELDVEDLYGNSIQGQSRQTVNFDFDLMGTYYKIVLGFIGYK